MVNISVDDVGARHDTIRRIDGAWERAITTLKRLQGLRRDRLVIGVNTVISRFNVERIDDIVRCVDTLGADSYVVEPAEVRAELAVQGSEFVADREKTVRALRAAAQWKTGRAGGPLPGLIRSLRQAVYEAMVDVLETGRRPAPCRAGTASVYLGPKGELRTCPARGFPMGNLREAGYDFSAVYEGSLAEAARALVARGTCVCTTATMCYVNLLMSGRGIGDVATKLLHGLTVQP